MEDNTVKTVFQQNMANIANKVYPVAGKTVLEIASDPWLLSAKQFKSLGAARVIASDIFDNWMQVPDDPDIETGLIDARNIPAVLGEQSVDVVYAINLLEHLSDLQQALDSIDRALKPGGFAFLHGHPLWSSARGHHVVLGYRGGNVKFGTPTDPIPKWGHLYMTPEQMGDDLRGRGLPDEVVNACLRWSFIADEITRMPRNAILAEFRKYAERGSLSIRAIWQDRLEIPTTDDLRAIRSSRWWDETEDYGVRGMTIILDKRA